MTQYTIAMTCSSGTGIAGDYIAETKRKALSMAKKEHGDRWTYYVHTEGKIGLNGRHYFIGRYWNDVDNQLESRPIKYGSEKDAQKELKRLTRLFDYDDWQIFWIQTDRDKQ